MAGAVGNAYRGSKATAGLCRPLMAPMPPHSVYMETHPGGGALMRRKPAALRRIGIDLDARALSGFECAYPVEPVQGCCHECPARYPFDGTEPVYSDPPYLRSTRKSGRRYRYDDEAADHEALPAGWRRVSWQVMNRAGAVTEQGWFDFAPDRVFRALYAGRNFTHRRQVGRKAANRGRRYRDLPAPERLAVLAAMMAAEAEQGHGNGKQNLVAHSVRDAPDVIQTAVPGRQGQRGMRSAVQRAVDAAAIAAGGVPGEDRFEADTELGPAEFPDRPGRDRETASRGPGPGPSRRAGGVNPRGGRDPPGPGQRVPGLRA